MTEIKSQFSFLYNKLLSENTKKRAEIFFVSLAILSFLLHILIITLVDLKVILANSHLKLLSNNI